MWGSPDAEVGRNLISFFLGASATPVFTLDGSTVVLDAPIPPVNIGLAYVTAYITGLVFDRVVFSDSGANAFEYVFSAGEQSTPDVPLPAGFLLLLSGLGGLGFLGRSRAKTA